MPGGKDLEEMPSPLNRVIFENEGSRSSFRSVLTRWFHTLFDSSFKDSIARGSDSSKIHLTLEKMSFCSSISTRCRNTKGSRRQNTALKPAETKSARYRMERELIENKCRILLYAQKHLVCPDFRLNQASVNLVAYLR